MARLLLPTLVFFAFASLISCNSRNLPAIGTKFEPPKQDEATYISYDNGKVARAYVQTISGIDYVVGINHVVTRKVVYLHTEDSDFETSEGFSLATTYLDLMNATGEKLKLDEGWGWYVTLPLGWSACFPLQDDQRQAPDVKEKVTWFCQKDF